MNYHSDDDHVDNFAYVMRLKMAESRKNGRSGWDDPNQCTIEFLKECLAKSIVKGDVVDIANFCMMLYQRESGHR